MPDNFRGKRNRALIAILLGCGLRRTESVELTTKDLQLREDHWVIADLVGKGKHIRTVPVPIWAKTAIDEWITAGGIADGKIFRRTNKNGKVWDLELRRRPSGMSSKLRPSRSRYQTSLHMIFAAAVHACAIWPAAS